VEPVVEGEYTPPANVTVEETVEEEYTPPVVVEQVCESFEPSCEEEPIWYNFIVNEELESWAVIATYDEEHKVFFLWNGADEAC
jgi:hypothetical protein